MLESLSTCSRPALLVSPSRPPSWTSTQWQLVGAPASSLGQPPDLGRDPQTCLPTHVQFQSSLPSPRSGLFVVGPESAGAHPGPACYRKGKG